MLQCGIGLYHLTMTAQSRVSSLRLLFAMFLLLGQVLAVVHATEHELADHGRASVCDICLNAHHGGAAPAPLMMPVPPLAVAHLIVAQVRIVTIVRDRLRPPLRAPPAVL